jgi:hypothetical protein
VKGNSVPNLPVRNSVPTTQNTPKTAKQTSPEENKMLDRYTEYCDK